MLKSKLNLYLIILAVVLSICAAVFTFLLTYEKDLDKIIKKEIANYIESPFDYEKIQIKIFKDFPHVSLAVKNLIIYENPEFGSDKLVTVKHLFFQMNVFSFLKKNYLIDQISVEKGILNLKTNQEGKVNYLVFKSDSGKSGELNLDLKKILIEKVVINYSNSKQNLHASLTVNSSYLTGLFQNTAYEIKSESVMIIDSLCYSSLNLIKKSELKIDFIVKVNNEIKEYSIEKINGVLDKIEIAASGKLRDDANKGLFVSFDLKTDGMKLSDILPLLPDSISQKDVVELTGNCNFRTRAEGYYSKNQIPLITADFNLNNGTALFKKENVLFENIVLTGNYTNDKNGKFEIKQAKMNHGKKNLVINFKMTNLTDPFIDLSFQSDISPEALILFSGNNDIKDVKGDISFNLQARGNLNDLKNSRFENTILKLNSDIRDLSLTFDIYKLQHLKGRIEANQTKINFFNLTGKFDNTNFKTTGIVADYFNYFDSLSNKKINLWANVEVDNADLDKYLAQSNPGNSDFSNEKYLFPEKLKYEINLIANKLKYEKFNCSNLKSSLIFDGKEISLKRVSMNTADGNLLATGKIFPQSDNYFQLDGYGQFNKMDIQQVFYQMDNFDQDFITDQHLRGRASGNLQFNLNISYDLNPDYNSIFCIADVVVEKGNIKNFKPLIDIFGFVKMKKLHDVYFDKLENTILIKEQLITIPFMNVYNSAFNISLSGTHSFKDEINYLFKVSLTELLLKQQKLLFQESDFTESDKTGGFNIYLSMTGTVDDYKIKPASIKVKQNMKESESTQKVEIQKLLKKKAPPPVSTQTFEFEWDDE